jgi:hypothetical protein
MTGVQFSVIVKELLGVCMIKVSKSWGAELFYLLFVSFGYLLVLIFPSNYEITSLLHVAT